MYYLYIYTQMYTLHNVCVHTYMPQCIRSYPVVTQSPSQEGESHVNLQFCPDSLNILIMHIIIRLCCLIENYKSTVHDFLRVCMLSPSQLLAHPLRVGLGRCGEGGLCSKRMLHISGVSHFVPFLLHSFVTCVSILSAHQKSQSGELPKIWG